MDAWRKPVVFVKTRTFGTAGGADPASGASRPTATASTTARTIPLWCLDEPRTREPEVERRRLWEGGARHVAEAAPVAAVGEPPGRDRDLHLGRGLIRVHERDAGLLAPERPRAGVDPEPALVARAFTRAVPRAPVPTAAGLAVREVAPESGHVGARRGGDRQRDERRDEGPPRDPRVLPRSPACKRRNRRRQKREKARFVTR